MRRRGRREDPSGRVVGVRPLRPGEPVADLALVPSLWAALRRGSKAGIAVKDLQRRVRRFPHHQLVVFVVDASESMGEGSLMRMAAAKGAVLALLKNAYLDRCRVALVAFHGEQAEVLLPPTRSIELARERLKRLPTGGATPFADGLWRGWQLIRRKRARNPGLRPLLVVISDGEANVPLQPGRAVMDELLELADRIRGEDIPALVIDSRPLPSKNREMERLARTFGTDCRRLGRLRSVQVFDLVRDAGALSS